MRWYDIFNFEITKLLKEDLDFRVQTVSGLIQLSDQYCLLMTFVFWLHFQSDIFDDTVGPIIVLHYK